MKASTRSSQQSALPTEAEQGPPAVPESLGSSQLDALVANVPGVVYRCEIDSDWTMRFVSEQMLELTGYPAADFIGNRVRSFDSVIHPEDRARVQRAVADATSAGRPFVMTYRIERADRRLRWVMERGREVADGEQRWLDGVILDVTAQHDAEETLRDALARQATLEERGRIARDLHDSVSQALFSISLHARAAQLAGDRAGLASGPVRDGIGELLTLANGALAEMRALIFELRPGALQEEGLTSAVRKHAAAVASRERMSITVTGPDRLPVACEVEEALYRIVQEALNNAVKHARADGIAIAITPEGDSVRVEVTDDGTGFDPSTGHPGHYGLHTMRERAERVGGRLELRSTPDSGTTLAVTARRAPEAEHAG